MIVIEFIIEKIIAIVMIIIMVKDLKKIDKVKK